ncbi:MAG: Rieske 2Fe-2S domain-containing protein [Anaerolineales bacterium]
MNKSSSSLTRRDFIKATAALIGSFIGLLSGLPAIGYLLSPALRAEEDQDAPISLGPVESYPIGVPTPFSITRTRVNGWERTAVEIGMYVLRKADGQVRVFSDICTHLGCRVRWHPEIQEYVSPCHHGHFDIEGNVTKGPPPRPLDEFHTRIEDGILYVTLPPFRRG